VGPGGCWLQPWRFGNEEKRDSATIFSVEERERERERDFFNLVYLKRRRERGKNKEKKMRQGLLTCQFIVAIRLYQGLRLKLLHGISILVNNRKLET